MTVGPVVVDDVKVCRGAFVDVADTNSHLWGIVLYKSYTKNATF